MGIRGGEGQCLVPMSISAPKNPEFLWSQPQPCRRSSSEEKKKEKAALGGVRIPIPPSIQLGCTAALLCPFPQPVFLEDQRGQDRNRGRSEDKQEPTACGMEMLREGMEALKALPWSDTDAL